MLVTWSKINGGLDEKPPSICRTSATGISNSSNNWRFAWLREMGTVRYLPSPDLRFRLRDDSTLLASYGQNR